MINGRMRPSHRARPHRLMAIAIEIGTDRQELPSFQHGSMVETVSLLNRV